MIIKIDGTTIKSPTKLKHGVYRISKSGRLSSGLMTMDIIAKKRRIDLDYGSISGRDMQQILDLLDANTFYTIEFPDPKNPFAQSTMTAYVGDVNLDYLRSGYDRMWQNITFPFIER